MIDMHKWREIYYLTIWLDLGGGYMTSVDLYCKIRLCVGNEIEMMKFQEKHNECYSFFYLNYTCIMDMLQVMV